MPSYYVFFNEKFIFYMYFTDIINFIRKIQSVWFYLEKALFWNPNRSPSNANLRYFTMQTLIHSNICYILVYIRSKNWVILYKCLAYMKAESHSDLEITMKMESVLLADPFRERILTCCLRKYNNPTPGWIFS